MGENRPLERGAATGFSWDSQPAKPRGLCGRGRVGGNRLSSSQGLGTRYQSLLGNSFCNLCATAPTKVDNSLVLDGTAEIQANSALARAGNGQGIHYTLTHPVPGAHSSATSLCLNTARSAQFSTGRKIAHQRDVDYVDQDSHHRAGVRPHPDLAPALPLRPSVERPRFGTARAC